MKLKVMTFNTQHCLNYVTREIDFDIMADTIKRYGADIVGLQEMRDEGELEDYAAQTKILAEKAGYEYYYFAKAVEFDGKNPYGNGILSKYPIVSAKTVQISEQGVTYKHPFEPRCILWAKIDVGTEIDVLVSHFGLTPPEKTNAVHTVMKCIQDQKCVLMGDFNLTPESAELIPIREKMQDAVDKVTGNVLSFPSDAPVRKIDYLFLSPDIKIVRAEIPQIVSSDHCPHIAEIEIDE